MSQFDRNKGLGASEAAGAMGLDPFISPTEVWMAKTNQGSDPTVNLAMKLGNLLEEPVARLYAMETGHIVERHRRACASCIRAHTEYACDRSAVWDPELPYLFAHLDRRTREAKGLPWEVLEIKTSGWPGEEWGKSGTDQVPLRVAVQVVLQMRLAGMERATVAALLWGRELRTYSIARDRSLEAQVLGEVEHFWQLVHSGEPPVHPDHQHTGRALRKLYPSEKGPLLEVVTNEGQWEMVQMVVDAFKRWKEAQQTYDTLKVEAMAHFKDRAGVEWDGGSITWKSSTRRHTDWERVAEWIGSLAIDKGLVFRDEWDAFVVGATTEESVRTFRVNLKRSKEQDA